MSVRLTDQAIRLEGACAVEDAESLLTLLQEHRAMPVDLESCGAMHLAVAQVLLAARPIVRGVPSDRFVREALLPLFHRLPD